MVRTYTVTRYSFREPDIIYEFEYRVLKENLRNDPNFTLIDKSDTMTSQFGGLFKVWIGLAITAIICSTLCFLDLLPDNETVWIIISLLGFISIIFLIFMLIMSLTDLSTYAGYLRKKRKYFTRMEKEIRKSTTYTDFCINFYK